jgi:hypothetical protein
MLARSMRSDARHQSARQTLSVLGHFRSEAKPARTPARLRRRTAMTRNRPMRLARTSLIACALALTLGVAVNATPAAAQNICKGSICVEIQSVSDVNRPLVRARVLLKSSAKWRTTNPLHGTSTQGATHYNVVIERGNQLEVRPSGRGFGPLAIELQRGQRNFSVQACNRPTVNGPSSCTAWASFTHEIAPPPPPPPAARQPVTVPNPTISGASPAGNVLRQSPGSAALRPLGRVPAPTAPTPAAPPPQKIATAKNDVDIYNSPVQPRNVIAMMRRGTQAPVLEYHTHGWCRLDIPSPKVIGWVARDHLTGCP